MKARLAATFVLALALTGCESSPPKAAPPSTAPATVKTAPTTLMVTAPKSVIAPATSAHSARPCWASPDTAYVTIDLNPDTPNPTCASVAPSQRIALVNRTDAFGQHGHQLTFTLAPFPQITLKPKQTVRFNQPVGDYLAPGDHVIPPTPGFTGFEIDVQPTSSPAPTVSTSPAHARPQGTLVVTADPAQGEGQDTSMYVGCTQWTVEVYDNSNTAIRSATFTAKSADYFVDANHTPPAPLPPPTTQYLNLAPGQHSQLKFQWCEHPYPSSEPGSYEVIIGTIAYAWVTGEVGRTCLGCT